MKKSITVVVDPELAKATHAAYVGYQQYQELIAQLITMGHSIKSKAIQEILEESRDVFESRANCYKLIELYTPDELKNSMNVRWEFKNFDTGEVMFSCEEFDANEVTNA